MAQGELPGSADSDELARILAALAMDAILRWARGDARRLRPWLNSRTDVILAGVAFVGTSQATGRCS